MKKVLLTLLAGIGLTASANAQLGAGTVAPDWTLRDLNGNWHNLYADLDSGYTVFLDVSAAWCPPCWSYHNSGALENLYTAHGPAGDNKVRIYFIEGESTNTTAQLYGTVANQQYSGFTQGDWVTGTPYPIIDTNAAATTAFNSAYGIGYFPTIYMICRDRLIQEVGQATTAQLWAAAQATCPTYGPSATTDAKAVVYTGPGIYVCNANPTVRFQNYSATNNITSATIKVFQGTNPTPVATVPWTGNLAPYAVASVTVPSFPGTAFEPYKFSVTVAGDAVTSNDTKDSIIKIYTAAGAVAAPMTESFESSPNFPARFAGDANTYIYSPVTGASGVNTRAIFFNFYGMQIGDVSEVIIGNFNTAAITNNLSLDFDVAAAPYAATPEQDRIQVMVSTDCGQSWQPTSYDKQGTALYTAPAPSPQGQFAPDAASDWRHERVNLTAFTNSNLLIKFKGTSGFGNLAWIDNIMLRNTTDVTEVIANNSMSIFPNPATDKATLQFSLVENAKVQVQVLDAMGRVISNVADQDMTAGQNTVSINTASFPAGLYTIKVTTGNNVSTQRLTVVK